MKPKPSLDNIVFYSLGRSSALFMSNHKKGTEQIMPTQELEAIGKKAITQIQSLLDEAYERGKVDGLKQSNGIAGALGRFAERTAKIPHKHWYMGYDKNHRVAFFPEEIGKTQARAVETTIETIRIETLNQDGLVNYRKSSITEKKESTNG